MNITIIGATGMVGTRTVAEAISRGHRVDAYTRSGKAPEGATAHSIDLADTAALVDIVNNHDVTIVAVPGGRGTSAHQEQARDCAGDRSGVVVHGECNLPEPRNDPPHVRVRGDSRPRGRPQPELR